MSKATSAVQKTAKRHDPLEASYGKSTGPAVRAIPHKKPTRKQNGSSTVDIDSDDFDVDAAERASAVTGRDAKRLMKAASAQRKEDEDTDISRIQSSLAASRAKSVTASRLLGLGSGASGNDGEDDDRVVAGDDDGIAFSDDDDDDTGSILGQEEIDIAAEEAEAFAGMSAADRAALEAFMPNERGTRQTLADVIMEKIAARERALALGLAPSAAEGGVEARGSAPEEVIQAYQKVGLYFSKYRSGKIPKIFKIIPTLKNWEEILYYTSPDRWTFHATSAATKLFATALNPKLAQRFYSLVLLPKVEEALERDQKLNPHLYDALRRAMYKPTAFFKGILLPLAQKGCLLRVALVFASVLRRISIPTMHAAVAIMKLTTIKPFNGPSGLFLKTLIRKRYALPLPTIAAVVEYLYSFINDGLEYPVLWHQIILCFVQRYRDALNDDQKAMLRALVKRKPHHLMSDEIKRELAGRNAEVAARAAAEDAAIDAEMRRVALAAGGGDPLAALQAASEEGTFIMDSLMMD